MIDTAIRVQGVTKWFERYGSSRARFVRLFRGQTQPPERFYALRDVHFEVEKGSAVGLLGRNGAGKSTMMQIVAGTMQPSEGRVEAQGRISPLLELGTGFNPEYTGAENVRLNAAVLGLSWQEIRRKEQEIADFADIGEFIDRPVKTYSSGMFARLAFAVAINVDPQILLVDEILAVGDMGFQHKCLHRLREMRQDGLTLVFVSHSPDAVKSVCDNAIFLHQGQVVFAGKADVVVDRYLAFIREATNAEQLKHDETHPWRRPVRRKVPLQAPLRYGSGHAQIVRVDILDANREPKRVFEFGETIIIEAQIESLTFVDDICVNLLVRDATGVDLFGTGTYDEKLQLRPMAPGDRQSVRFSFPAVTRIGTYGVSISITRVTKPDYSDAFLFDQADGVCTYAVSAKSGRPVHYKFYVDTKIEVLKAVPNAKEPAVGEV